MVLGGFATTVRYDRGLDNRCSAAGKRLLHTFEPYDAVSCGYQG
jgi:hypothetical protein